MERTEKGERRGRSKWDVGSGEQEVEKFRRERER